ncbi:MAG: hypothetical protein HY812_19895, partial [Planctomycetes bacterium]|nr:hypothetical protein [Planctomycetota bacterium]
MADEAPRGFGHPSRFYAQGAAKPANGLFASDPGLDWGAVLARASPKLREEVQRVCRQWSALLRDHLRSETGLRLSVPGDQQAVPVKVVDGMPLPFVESMRPFAGFEWLLLHRPAVEAAASGTRFMERQAAPIALL